MVITKLRKWPRPPEKRFLPVILVVSPFPFVPKPRRRPVSLLTLKDDFLRRGRQLAEVLEKLFLPRPVVLRLLLGRVRVGVAAAAAARLVGRGRRRRVQAPHAGVRRGGGGGGPEAIGGRRRPWEMK